MGMTIAEKIIAAAAGVDSVKPGDIHTVQLDRLMSNDGTTHLTVDMYKNKLNHPHIADTKKLVFIVDHNVPSDCPKTAASQKKMRDFAKENNIDFWEGKGVCHHYIEEVCTSDTGTKCTKCTIRTGMAVRTKDQFTRANIILDHNLVHLVPVSDVQTSSMEW